FAVDFEKDFIGKEALTAEVHSAPTKRLVQFTVETKDAWLFGDEPIYWNNSFVGLVTSAAFGHTVGSMLAFGYFNCERAADAICQGWGTLEVEVLGIRHPAKPIMRPLYDPTGERLRS